MNYDINYNFENIEDFEKNRIVENFSDDYDEHDFARDVSDGIKNTAYDVSDGIKNTVYDAGDEIKNTVYDAGDEIKNTAYDVYDEIKKLNEVGKAEIDFGGDVGRLKITSGGKFYGAYKASQQPRYITRPHLVNASDAKKKRDGQVERITAGSGPLAMVMIYIIDFLIDMFIDIFSEVLIFFSDGFEYMYIWIMGGFRGVLPFVTDLNREESIDGLAINYNYIRYIITIISPPVGVFLGKGLRGFMSIIICTALTYINFIVGVIYALTITYKNRFADYYEEHEAKKYKAKDEDIKKRGNAFNVKYLLGVIIIICAICFLFIGMAKLAMYSVDKVK